MKNTKRGKITWANFFHGLIISIGSAVISGFTTALTSGTVDVKTVQAAKEAMMIFFKDVNIQFDPPQTAVF